MSSSAIPLRSLQSRATGSTSRLNDSTGSTPELLLPPSSPGLLARVSFRSSVRSNLGEVHDFLYGSAPVGDDSGRNVRRDTVYSLEKADNFPEEDDYLHEAVAPSKVVGECRYVHEPRSFRGTRFWSSRGALNIGVIVLLLGGLIATFGVYPIVNFAYNTDYTNSTGYFAGSPTGPAVSGTGAMINNMTNLPLIFARTGPVDPDTPTSAKTLTNFDGVEMSLVFSDEFETPGRTFYPYEDPFFTAVDLHYWQTGDLEWYDPGNAVTQDGYLLINLTQETNASSHGLGYLGAMLQSWNQFCFTGGRIEVSLSLPGSPDVSGLWPSVWTLGNLGRAGYGGSLEGTWPYSYEACDVGTVKNQTIDGLPADAVGLSYLPGQKLSACTCPGEDHPGPTVKNGSFVGRAAPEIDLFEAISSASVGGRVSQSAQWAPFTAGYAIANASIAESWVDYNLSATDFGTKANTYVGGVDQQSTSGLSDVSDSCFSSATTFCTFGYEYTPSYLSNGVGNISWISEGEQVWRVDERAIGADAATETSARAISNEPMSIVMNLGISDSFTALSPDMTYPDLMRIDWIRVYQPTKGDMTYSCSPPSYPTEEYINHHLGAYMNPNITTWAQYENSTFPKNRLVDSC